MVCVIVQNKVNINIVYFQFTAQNGSSLKGNFYMLAYNVQGKINYNLHSIMITTQKIVKK